MTARGSDRLRIGLFGGTFDPPHSGHVAVATDVAHHLDLDRVLWIPAGEPPHKSGAKVSPAEVRLEMVRAAARSDPRFEVSTIEIERPGPSYMVDTVRALREERPDDELFLIIGADEFRVFDAWRDPQEIVKYVRLAVMDREGRAAEDFATDVTGGREAVFVPVRRVDISSSAVRAAVQEGLAAGAWVPADVAEVLEREGLYRDTDPA
jgi:nicotinate-nucleotide adenylyltransferase